MKKSGGVNIFIDTVVNSENVLLCPKTALLALKGFSTTFKTLPTAPYCDKMKNLPLLMLFQRRYSSIPPSCPSPVRTSSVRVWQGTPLKLWWCWNSNVGRGKCQFIFYFIGMEVVGKF